MSTVCIDEFVRLLKYGTLWHHHASIDRIFDDFKHTRDYTKFARDLIRQTGSRDAILESMYLATDNVASATTE